MSVEKKYSEIIVDVTAIESLMNHCTDDNMKEEMFVVSTVLIQHAIKSWPNKPMSTMDNDIKRAFNIIKNRNSEILR